MDTPYQVIPDIEILPAHFQVPGAGYLPVNAFVIKAKEPVLIDTGMGIDNKTFMSALESIIDPKELRWIWITHDDADHTGSLQMILKAAPMARIAIYSLAMLRISSAWPIPLDRVHWLNPGDAINAGDRYLKAVRPPLFDNPTTIGLYDENTKTLFSADCFGSIIPSPAKNVEELEKEYVPEGITNWASLDNPWVHFIKSDKFKETLDSIRNLAPETILSSHLPPAQGRTEQLLKILESVPDSPPSIAPNQNALEQILGESKEKSKA